MTSRRLVTEITLGVLAWMVLLHPPTAVAQQTFPSLANAMGTAAADDTPKLPMPSEPDHDAPQNSGASGFNMHAGETFSEPFNLQSTFKRATAGFVYTFTPAGTPEFSGLNSGHSTEQWGNSFVGVFRADATNATSFLMTADLETVGQQAQGNGLALPGGSDLMLEYLGTRSLALGGRHARSFEVGVGAFQHWLVSSPLSPGGLFRGQFPGYSLYSQGVETTFTLPDSNTTLTVRYGNEHLANDSQRKPTVGFELSWTW
jgi:hypothetical protein